MGNRIGAAGARALVGGAPLAGLRHLCVSDPTAADRTALEARFKARVEFPT